MEYLVILFLCDEHVFVSIVLKSSTSFLSKQLSLLVNTNWLGYRKYATKIRDRKMQIGVVIERFRLHPFVASNCSFIYSTKFTLQRSDISFNWRSLSFCVTEVSSVTEPNRFNWNMLNQMISRRFVLILNLNGIDTYYKDCLFVLQRTLA